MIVVAVDFCLGRKRLYIPWYMCWFSENHIIFRFSLIVHCLDFRMCKMTRGHLVVPPFESFRMLRVVNKAVNVESQARLRHDKGQLEEHVRQVWFLAPGWDDDTQTNVFAEIGVSPN